MNHSLFMLFASLATFLAIISITRHYANRHRRTVTSTSVPPWLHPCPACHALLAEDRNLRLHRVFLHCFACDYVASFPLKESSDLSTCLALSSRNGPHVFTPPVK